MTNRVVSPLTKRQKITRTLVNRFVKIATGAICKVDGRQLVRVPLVGPLIVIVNHVNFLELPVLYPRVPTDWGIGFSKDGNWKNPLYRLLFGVWNVIPINRDEVDLTAMRRGLEALEAGYILFVTPEGTRSHHGRLQKGKPGVVMLAQRSGAPVLPIACYGGEKYRDNLRRLRRTDYHIAVGRPFHIELDGEKVTRHVRQQVVDEMMYQLAALMPPEYHGIYTNPETAGASHLRFEMSSLPGTRPGV
ncbi:MAG: 1-acyl-sn-glycerol-3-phosphate acyltransferase [Anaerolineae bacterium]|nr:1-acyl-sn-glycerol-3-phosphate acyltransferase [Anaerolineae bacterium]